MRKKIVPDSDFVEAVVTDNEAEGAEDNEDKKEDDEESDAGDLEWESKHVFSFTEVSSEILDIGLIVDYYFH